MKRIKMIGLMLLIIAGCRKEIVEISEPVDITAPSEARSSKEAPYNASKFRPVLNKCKYQNSKLDRSITTRQIQRGYYSDNIYLKNGIYLRFDASGAKARSELRQEKGEWKVTSSRSKTLSAKVKLFSPPSSIEEVTIAQIHSDNSVSGKPFLRIAYIKNRKGKRNHIWAIIRTKDIESHNVRYEKKDLSELLSGHTDLEITVRNKKLYVSYSNKRISYPIDASWHRRSMHFKAGCYIQKNHGRCRVEFKKLEIH